MTEQQLLDQGFKRYKDERPSGSGWYRLCDEPEANYIRAVYVTDLRSDDVEGNFTNDPDPFVWGWDPTDDPEALTISWRVESLYWARIVQP